MAGKHAGFRAAYAYERRLIRNMTDFLGVSKSALLIRLKQLNLLDYRNWDEYLEEEEFDSLLGGY